MKLSPVAGTYAPTIENGYSNYSVVPAEYTKVATFASTTDATIGSSLTSTYQAYVNGLQAAGTYAGKVKYTLVHPASEVPTAPVVTNPGYISYNPNATGVTDTMGDQSISNTDTSADLWASNFKREGYGFAGWNDKFDYTGNNYGPNETISFTAGQYSGDNNGLSLYAIWVPSAGSLQNWTGCSSLNTGDVTALTDQRDNNTYAVAKLADGKCWMIENLRLDNTAAYNTDGSQAQGYNPSFIGLAAPESPWASNSIVANSLYSTDGSTAATISGSNQSYRFPRCNNDNTANPTNNMTAWDNNFNIYSLGNYYTWPAVVADTNNYTTNNQSITTTSICPAGWHIPTGGDSSNANNSEFWQLGLAIMDNIAPDQTSYYSYYSNAPTNTASKTATAAFRSYPNNFIYSGALSNSSINSRSTVGVYQSSTVLTTGFNNYHLSLNSTSVRPGTIGGVKFFGSMVRCLVP